MSWINGVGWGGVGWGGVGWVGVGASGSDANSLCCQEPFKRVMEWGK